MTVRRTRTEAATFLNLRIFAERSGYRVTGRVEFPHPVCGKSSCPIDYSARRLDDADDNTAPIDGDTKYRQRLDLIALHSRLADDHPAMNKRQLAQRAIDESGLDVSVRTLQTWKRKWELEGAVGLKDKYVAMPKRILTLTSAQALSAIKVCSWWSYRIGSVTQIDNKMIRVSVGLLNAGYALADLVATIDCYYAWPTDRQKFPFKPFSRWAKYDFEKWLFRACDANDYRRGLDAAQHQTPLQAPATARSSGVADPKTRKRETLHRGTRRAIRDMHPVDSDAPRTPVEPVSNTLRAANKLRRVGCDRAAQDTIKSAASGLPALSLNSEPKTIAEAMATLDDSYRRMLLSAAHGDRQARDQAIATMSLWWDSMPQAERNNIDFRVDAWKADHPTVTDRQVAMRKIDMLLPKIRNRNSGAQKLFPAARTVL